MCIHPFIRPPPDGFLAVMAMTTDKTSINKIGGTSEMRKIFRRCLAAAMSVIVAASSAMSVNAAGVQQEDKIGTLRQSSGLSMTCEETGLKFTSGTYAGEPIWFMRASGDYVFCMNKGARMHTGASYKVNNNYWNTVDANTRELIGRAFAISYDPTYGGGPDTYPCYFYTRQLLLWEMMASKSRWDTNNRHIVH